MFETSSAESTNALAYSTNSCVVCFICLFLPLQKQSTANSISMYFPFRFHWGSFCYFKFRWRPDIVPSNNAAVVRLKRRHSLQTTRCHIVRHRQNGKRATASVVQGRCHCPYCRRWVVSFMLTYVIKHAQRHSIMAESVALRSNDSARRT